MQHLILTVVAGATLTISTSAQPPVPPPDLKAVLNLSDSQVQSLTTLQQQKMQALEPLVQQLAQDQQKLGQLIDSNPDPASIVSLVLEIAKLSKQTQQVAGGFQQQALNVLQDDQKSKVSTLADVLRLQQAAHQAAAIGLVNPPAN